MSMFALVSTIDTLGEKFPSHCVMLFRTEGEAYAFAADLLVTHDPQVEKTEKGWSIDDPDYDTPVEYYSAASLVSGWQDDLPDVQYFHVFPVADLPQTVRELFLDRDHESFVRSIEIMNQMYRLQVSTVPTLTFVDNKADGTQHTVNAFTRLHGFKKTLQGELNEIELIIGMANRLFHEPDVGPDEYRQALPVEILTAVADLLADIVVYCVSEMRKFGLPPAAIMSIVMQSNMSKLQPDGSAKYDDNGKFLKGPNYFPPEPKIRELIVDLLEGHDPLS